MTFWTSSAVQRKKCDMSCCALSSSSWLLRYHSWVWHKRLWQPMTPSSSDYFPEQVKKSSLQPFSAAFHSQCSFFSQDWNWIRRTVRKAERRIQLPWKSNKGSKKHLTWSKWKVRFSILKLTHSTNCTTTREHFPTKRKSQKESSLFSTSWSFTQISFRTRTQSR